MSLAYQSCTDIKSASYLTSESYKRQCSSWEKSS